MNRGSRSVATFGQISDAPAIIFGVPQKFNAELAVFVPAHDRDFVSEQRFCLRLLNLQQRNVKVLVKGGITM
ncbi:MAG TPA: hypothetical protein DDY39_11215 [Nitrospira sp.]|nr:hypothetical protein [Nitrospira sp.]HBR48872.1 hypothetical protein [Nitrospira sp.]